MIDNLSGRKSVPCIYRPFLSYMIPVPDGLEKSKDDKAVRVEEDKVADILKVLEVVRNGYTFAGKY